MNNAGNHYLACGDPAKARTYFERLIEMEPAHANANLQIARLDMAAGGFARAEQRLATLASAYPGDFDILFLLGRAAARAGNSQRARQALETALALRPADTGAMVEAGLANAAAGDFPRAVFLLARARSQAPKHPGVALALARASEDAGYYGDAVAAYDHYLAIEPKDAAAFRDRARARAFTGSGRGQGLRELDEYLTRNPRDAIAHFYSAQIRWSDNAEAALTSLAEAVRLDPSLAGAHVARAWLLHRLGRDEEALPHLEAALKATPNDVRALDQMGVTLIALDRAKDAEPHLRKAASLAPADADVALHLGRALVDQGNETEGRQWLDAYSKLRPPRQREARREAGMIELAVLDPSGRRAREIERFRAMARSRPDDPLLQLHLAELLLADGQTTEALREYRVLLAANGDTALWSQAGRALFDAAEYEAARPFLARAGMRLELAEVLLRTDGGASALAAIDAIPEDERRAPHLLLRARALDAAGRNSEAKRALDQALAETPMPPPMIPSAALLLAKYDRHQQAIDMLSGAIIATPAVRELRLTEAIVLGLRRDPSTVRRLEELEKRWPDWDRPWLVHGLVLAEAKRSQDAVAKLRTATALGSRQDVSACATLREWVFGACAK